MDQPSPTDAAIRTDRIRREFGSAVAVDDVSLTVARGEIFAVVGSDGAGKTTLIRLLSGVMAPTSGAARVAGFDVVMQAESVKARIGYMPQRFSLYGDLTLMENLRLYADIYAVPRRVFGERAAALLGDFGLSHFVDRFARELSGGMKQKLALASTLIHEPELLLLDEPTAGVDPVSRRRFWRLLYQLNARGKTIYVNTPYMDEAEHATQVALMHHGAVVACDTPRSLKHQIKGDVIEIIAPDVNAARRAMRELPYIRSLEIFGSRLHALVPAADAALPGIRARLEEHGVLGAQLARIEPSLEDAFVALIGSRSAA